ncbi:sec-independent protein translocase protein TatC [Desulfomicrobium norvegicum]|uniref:Sec-independent protein translocase protein TatC n=1 Tax=Desulfomicrobium norvegicum (strain DSM 1741 / NCIMB 8310) TaxID=52561 RepID=A0A8G2C569_DESNO|nr:twin-arginine translocase subunit TatC [Desulfomicrobium norvegicum]SFM07630.1 sec-independent protein translocase protein TatC [Desulfomicrobium norvegicum]
MSEERTDRDRIEDEAGAESEGTSSLNQGEGTAEDPALNDSSDKGHAPGLDLGDAVASDEAEDGASRPTEDSPSEDSADPEPLSPEAQDSGDAAESTSDIAPKGDGGVAEAEAKAEPEEEEPVHEMTFTEHLNELRVRLVRCIIAAFVGLLVCYAFAEQLFMMLMQPLITLLEPSGGSLIYTGLPEAFFTHLKVAAIAGLFVASPYIFYQLWMFIAPGLYEGERKYMIPIALCSALCFVSGALFGYYVVFPFGFQFFLGYASDVIKPMPSVREYFSFSTSMLFAFGFIFELPLFMFFLSILGIVTHQTLRKYRKFAILGSFVVAAVLTPPDVVSQTLMAGPLCILYEIGIWVAYAFGKKRKESPAEDDATAEAKG